MVASSTNRDCFHLKMCSSGQSAELGPTKTLCILQIKCNWRATWVKCKSSMYSTRQIYKIRFEVSKGTCAEAALKIYVCFRFKKKKKDLLRMVYTTGLLETMVTSVNAEVCRWSLYWPQGQLGWFQVPLSSKEPGSLLDRGTWKAAFTGSLCQLMTGSGTFKIAHSTVYTQ